MLGGINTLKGMKEGGKEGKKEERRHRQAGAAGPYVGEERKRGFKCPSSLMSAASWWVTRPSLFESIACISSAARASGVSLLDAAAVSSDRLFRV